jgi:lipoprotein-releasing system permease protein
MQTPLSFYIGKRYASIGSRNQLIGFISLLSVLGLSLGVAILVTVLSVINGFDRELQNRILAMVPHITMYSPRSNALLPVAQWQETENRLAAIEGVTGTSPYLQVEGMLVANGRSEGIALSGIDPDAERDISIIEDFITEGTFEGLADRSYRILLGAGLADTLGVKTGDQVTLISTVVPITPLGEFTRKKIFEVGGVFQVGSNLDSGLAVAHLADVQRVYRLGNTIHGLRIQVNDLFNVEEISTRIRQDISNDFMLSNWTWDYGNIYENIRLSKSLVGLLLSLLVAVAAFNVVVSLVMVVKEKRGDIAILRTMGTSLGSIRNIFLVQGLGIGLMGTGIGLVLGIVFSLTVSDLVSGLEQLLNIQFLSADIYPVNYLPSRLQWDDLLVVSCIALALTVLATLLPASAAARTDPAEVLRYE